ncbi:unnamed protein product [Spirodela intermedia]|uniref:Uncharacterized protein n=1 Tax=Spirodela intermedia TaxID=51605 RepID=A0ABN7E9M8_SPIIN|nr:unnamed protein product [Spirodela intermedia]
MPFMTIGFRLVELFLSGGYP